MQSVYGEQEDYYGRCGELFLTVKGNIAFHCTLCENKYKNFQEYNEHILLTHYDPDIKEEIVTDSIHEEDNSHDPLSEESYNIDAEELIVKEDDELETYSIPKGTPQIVNQDGSKENAKELIEVSAPIATSSNPPQNEMIRAQLKCINVKSTITNRKYKCPYCGFAGADKSNIQSHIKRHSMNKPHKCTECSKTFYFRTELKTHIRSHTGERPFLCTLCGRAFITASRLSCHQKRHTNVRDKECPVCKMRFFGLDTLRGHMVVHSEKREHKCDQCDASFKTRTALKTHMKLHENKREYQCKLCDSRFNQNAGLYSHMKNCHTVVVKSSKVLSKNEVED